MKNILKRLNIGKIVAILVIIGILVGGGVFLIPKVIEEMKGNGGSINSGNSGNSGISAGTVDDGGKYVSNQTVKISIDEWIGYDSLLQANGGTKTTKVDELYKYA